MKHYDGYSPTQVKPSEARPQPTLHVVHFVALHSLQLATHSAKHVVGYYI